MLVGGTSESIAFSSFPCSAVPTCCAGLRHIVCIHRCRCRRSSARPHGHSRGLIITIISQAIRKQGNDLLMDLAVAQTRAFMASPTRRLPAALPFRPVRSRRRGLGL